MIEVFVVTDMTEAARAGLLSPDEIDDLCGALLNTPVFDTNTDNEPAVATDLTRQIILDDVRGVFMELVLEFPHD